MSDATSPADVRRPIIAVVDDEAGIVVFCRKILDRSGFSILVGRDGRDAISIRFGDPEPDAMFVNWLMPVMSGAIAIKAIRHREAAEGRRRMPIVVESEFSDRVLSEIGLYGSGWDPGLVLSRLDADGLLRKPFDVDGFLASVRDLLANRQTD